MAKRPTKRRLTSSRSAVLTLLFALGLSLSTAACGSILGAEDEYVIEAPGGGAAGDAPVAGSAGDAGSGGLAGAAGVGGAGAAAGISGAGGDAAASGSAGTAGASGESGASGSAGDAGSAGASGAAGAAGDAGAAGAAGAAGDAGAAGAAGEAGAAGNAGSAGATAGAGGADAGSAGVGGDAGAAGDAGSAGVGGDAGAAGASGAGAGGQAGGGAAGAAGSAGAGAGAGAGGAAGGAAGAAGAAGNAGAGGATDPGCCESELEGVLSTLAAQYKNIGTTPAFSYSPPSNSQCYDYTTLASNQNGTIRFGAKSKRPLCKDLAGQVTGYDSTKSTELPKVVTGLCVASGTNAAAVNASASFCSATGQIACTTVVAGGSDAITSAQCQAADCNQCVVAAATTINKWLTTQRNYFNATGKLDTTLAAPADSPCYAYGFTYSSNEWIMFKGVPKNVACGSIAARAERGISNPSAMFGGACLVAPGPNPYNWPASGDAQSYFSDDCESPAGGGTATQIVCETNATPIAGTGAVSPSQSCP